MNSLFAALKGEYTKIIKSKVMPVTFAAAVIMPAMMAFMIFVAKDPALAHKLGIIGTKAKIIGTPDWPSFFNLLTQSACGIQLVIFGFVTSWIFGREYSDRTIKDLLALPLPRHAVVIAKLIAAALWCAALFVFIFAAAIAGGAAVGLTGWNTNVLAENFVTLFITSLAVIYLNSVVAFIACASRGYLAAVGFVILSAILINFAGAIGFSEYYPWAVPMLFAVKSGGIVPGVASWVIVLITGAAGIAAAVGWWRYADQA
ncbi:MAG: ABC transporter permease [Candidatus Goldiibacteriota bacterium]